jgi:hypothetical protein
MNKLILSLVFIPALAFGQKKEISDKAIENQFLTVVKDVEVETMLGKTAEFNDCRKLNEFNSKDKKPERDQKLADATKCFEEKLAKNKDPKALQNLADSLKLENFGLIKSKNVNDITKYLSKKMHKSLTGVDIDDKNSKWGHEKIVDQKVFIDLYTNQLMKSALFEVSRFCFENLEIGGAGVTPTTKAGSNFSSYWYPANSTTKIVDFEPDPKYPNDPKKMRAKIQGISDTGSTSFLDMTNIDVTKKEDVLKHIQKGITSSDTKPDQYKEFFSFCQSTITQLCDEFRSKDAGVKNATKNETKDTTTIKGMSRGANACLTMDKLQSLRTTMANTAKVAAQFDEMGEEKDKFALKMIQNPNIYERGKGKNEDSLDDITTATSADMLQDGGDDKLSNLETQCKADATTEDCKAYLVENESLDKAINNVESEMNLKRQIEIARVREMHGKVDDLKKYLTDNGHFDLLDKLEKDNTYDIGPELAKIYDARKVAEIENLKLKVGKRQVSEADNKTDVDKKDMIEKNIKDTKEERARIAQVVMFNNIITSQLELEDNAGNKVGRNVTGVNKEFAGMGKAYDPNLFSGIQADAKKSGSGLDDISISGGGIIDSILGKKSE